VKRPLDEYVRDRRAIIDTALRRFLPAPPACPPIVADAMRYSVFAGGKRFRPILTLAAAESVAEHPDVRVRWGRRSVDEVVALALPAGCAVEMIHTYSLIHDDLPAMDDDTLRRGRPTLHVVYGEGMAILAGDGLLTEAFALLAREPAGETADVALAKLRVIETIARAAGTGGMVGGQAIDLQVTGSASGSVASVEPLNSAPSAPSAERLDSAYSAPSAEPLGSAPSAEKTDVLERMHACKTGALIRGASVAGAIMAGGTSQMVAAIDEYAAELGLAFQIVDDVLDVEGDAGDMGKTIGKDAAAGKLTFPALFGLAQSRKRARACADRAHAVLAAARLDQGYLDDIVEWVVGRKT
jgi:geranylgeranyl diphosphate synthase type II